MSSLQRSNLMEIAGDVEIRKFKSLSPSHAVKLVQFLEENDSWRVLMSIVPKVLPQDARSLRGGKDSWEKLYNATHIKLVENASKKDPRTPAEIFLFEWSTTGRRRATVVHLLELLKAANLYRAADYIAMEVLQQGAVERPTTGPAAKINLLELDEELEDENVNPQVSNVTIEQNLDNSKAQNYDASAPKLMPKTLQAENNNTGCDRSTVRIGQENLPVVKITEATESIKFDNRGVGNYSEQSERSDGECKVENIILQSPPDSSILTFSDCSSISSSTIFSGVLSSRELQSTSITSENLDARPNFSELLIGDTTHHNTREISSDISSCTSTTSDNLPRPNLSALLSATDMPNQNLDENHPVGLHGESEMTPAMPAFSSLLTSGDVHSSNIPVFDNLMSGNAKSDEFPGIPAFSGLLGDVNSNTMSPNESFEQSTSSDDD